jgi:hypothetical protein
MWNIWFFPPELFLYSYKCDGYVPCCVTMNTHMIVNWKKFSEIAMTTLAHYIWVEGWYQWPYGKFHVIIYLSHISHWLFSSIDFYIAYKIFELTNCKNKYFCFQSCELLKTSKWVQGKAVVGDQKILSHLDLISV